MSQVGAQKDGMRERIWRTLEETGVARFPTPIRGRIPNFEGAEAAASLLSQVDEFRKAKVVKVNPDSPQRPFRLLVLKSGKKLLVPTPRIAKGFQLLDPKEIPERLYGFASTISGSYQHGRSIDLTSLPEVDFIVAGSVAVDSQGNRLGKGEGYSEIEYAILAELGKVSQRTPVATTVHELQLVDVIPSEPFDFQVDVIATPSRIIRTPRGRSKPPGVFWDLLSKEKIESIPALRQLRSLKRPKTQTTPCRRGGSELSFTRCSESRGKDT